LLDDHQDMPAIHRISRVQKPMALGGTTGSNRKPGPVRFIDARFHQGKALRVVVQAQRRKGQIVFQLRGAGLQLDGSPRVLEPSLPLCERVVNDAQNTVGVGALGTLGQGEPGDLAGQIQPTEVEQIFRRSSQNFSREHR
jgi:hypothetical protein